MLSSDFSFKMTTVSKYKVIYFYFLYTSTKYICAVI